MSQENVEIVRAYVEAFDARDTEALLELCVGGLGDQLLEDMPGDVLTQTELLGIGTSLAGQLLLFDSLETTFRKVKVPRDPACALCGPQATIRDLQTSNAREIIQHVVRSVQQYSDGATQTDDITLLEE